MQCNRGPQGACVHAQFLQMLLCCIKSLHNACNTKLSVQSERALAMVSLPPNRPRVLRLHWVIKTVVSIGPGNCQCCLLGH